MVHSSSSASAASQPALKSAIYRRLFREYVAPHKIALVHIFSLMVIVAAAGGIYPALISHIFHRLEHPDSASFYAQWVGDSLLVVPVLIIIMAGIKAAAMYFQVLAVNAFTLRITTTLQKKMMSHLIDADLAVHSSQPAGSFISRIMNDMNLVREAVVRLANNLVRDMLTALVMIGVMFWFSWLLSVLVLAIYPLAMRPIITIGNRQRKASSTLQNHMADVTSLLAESLQGIRMVKAYQLEHHEQKRANSAFDALYQQLVQLLAGRARIDPILEVLGGVAIAGVIGLAGWQVAQGQLQTSDVIGFITALVMLVPPIRAIGTLNAVSEEGAAALSRIFALLDKQNDITDRPDAQILDTDTAEITFKDVSFGYGDTAVLHQISFTLKAGQTVALVGSSGSGKSTIINLLPRFFDVSSGQVCINGVDVKDIQLASLRQHIALVAQDAVLFDASISQNIGFGAKDASDEMIIRAAELADAQRFISSLDKGYDSDVGVQGSRLSGGQKQRIAIARAMVRDAPVLLLDEATSALDAQSEKAVQHAIEKLAAGRSTLIVAHRLSSIIHADEILVIDKGKIVQRGTHQSLLAQDGLYAQLCALQNITA